MRWLRGAHTDSPRGLLSVLQLGATGGVALSQGSGPKGYVHSQDILRRTENGSAAARGAERWGRDTEHRACLGSKTCSRSQLWMSHTSVGQNSRNCMPKRRASPRAKRASMELGSFSVGMPCPRQHYSQWPKGGDHPSVHPQVSDDRTWSLHTTTSIWPQDGGDPTLVRPRRAPRMQGRRRAGHTGQTRGSSDRRARGRARVPDTESGWGSRGWGRAGGSLSGGRVSVWGGGGDGHTALGVYLMPLDT